VIPGRSVEAGGPPPGDDPGLGRSARLRAISARVLAFGRAGLPVCPECSNIASAVGVMQYRTIAAEVASWLPRGRILDWGAGWGQASLFLRAHDLEVVAHDVEDKGAATGLLAGETVPYVVAPGPGLPFPDGAFDAVLNCGVLEHVAEETAALAELFRVLRADGWLFTYHLPNRHAYTEWLGRHLGRFHHDRTYRRQDAIALLEGAGFAVVRCRPFHVLPRNVWARLGGGWAGEGVASLHERLDARLARLPGLARLATAWSLIARRRR
jgi:2-polyprenyl-3-methyl-5-hydroxy-6-metoxy-1,4-benzoquinol methylase